MTHVANNKWRCLLFSEQSRCADKTVNTSMDNMSSVVQNIKVIRMIQRSCQLTATEQD